MSRSDSPLRALIVEDSEDDTLLLARRLRAEGFDLQYQRVDNRSAMAEALERQRWDVVFSDFDLPGFSIWAALEMTRSHDPDLPFIVVSGVIDTEIAASAMKLGAHDYVLKDDLGRLVPALLRELAEAGVRRDRLRLSDALKTHELRTQTILDASADAIVSIDAQGTILSINRTGEEMFGYAAVEVLGQPVTVLMPAPHRLNHPGYVRRHLSTGRRGGMGVERRLTALRKDGSEIPIAAQVRTMKLGDSHVFVATIRNLTEQRHLEEQSKELAARLHQAEKLEALGTMASSIAHDLSNFVAPIAIYAQTLTQDGVDDEARKNAAKEIFDITQRTQALVGQILSFTRNQRAQPVIIDLCAIAREAATPLREMLPANVEFVLRLPEQPIFILAGEAQMHQVLNNLLTNASRAVRAGGGRIGLELDQAQLEVGDERLPRALLPGRYAMLRVTDTGEGMAPDVASKVFEPFFTTREDEGGMGLGLATVYRIARAYRGAIEVRSTPGEGSTFEVTLPVTEP